MTGAIVDGVASRERASLRFDGLDQGSGELTWGQRFVWDILESLAPANHYLNIRFRVHLPGGATRERVLAALHTLVRRHEALRSRFAVGPDGEPRQRCDPAGELAVEFVETDPGQVRRLAEADEQRLWGEPFQHERQWPLRVSVIAAGGRLRQVVFVCSHLAADAWGCAVLRKEFLALLRDEGAQPAGAGWQPRGRAAWEASPSGRGAHERSLAYWRRVLATAPQTAFPVLPEPSQTPRFPGVGLHSVALSAAARALAARLRVGPAAVVLGVLSTVIGIRTSTEAVPLCLATGNRFTPADLASVGTFYQSALAVIRLDPASLAGTIRHAHRAATAAYLRGAGDPREIARLVAAVQTRRGVGIDLSSTVNVVPEPGIPATLPTTQDVAELRRLTAQTQVSDLAGRDREQLKLYLHVKSLHSRAIIELFCDSRFLSTADARRLLAGLEQVLVELLDAGDLPIDRVAGVVGIAPLARPAGSTLVDGCWVDLARVQEGLAGLPGTAASQVFVDDRGEAPARLVGYVAASPGEPVTPERLHTGLMSRLDGHLTMTPQWYVVCGSAPVRRDSRAQWQQQPVLAQGSGRGGEDLEGLPCCP